MKDLLEKYFDYVVKLRREFHMHPEASLKETWTTDRIERELHDIGIETKRITPTGITGYLRGSEPGKTIALRADIDALDLEELNDVSYKSQCSGFMHGCGHDGHTSSLLCAARVLKEMQDQIKGTVKFVFQPAEELGLGAKQMIENGVLDDVDAIFGIHIWNDLPVGKINIEEGPRMAAGSHFKCSVTGKGGHGALPNQGVDALVCASAMVLNLQTIISREVSPLAPAVVTIGKLVSGSRFNILAETAYFEGTTRCYDDEVNQHIQDALKRIIDETAKSYRATAELEYNQVVVATINDKEMAEIGQTAAKDLFGDCLVEMEKQTGGEDFSFYGRKVPAAFAFVGSKNEAKIEYHPHHHPKFDIDEDALKYTAGLYANYALTFLSAK